MIRIGISGWTYTPWRGTFYPNGLSQKNELAYASAMLPSIEINGTFYSLQKPKSYAAWYEQTPSEFVFSLKAPRFVTHIRRLHDVKMPVANFFASGPLRLNEKLGPILWQLPPTLKYDAQLIEDFLSLLPRSTSAAMIVATSADIQGKDRLWTTIDEDRPLRHAMEVRHASFKNEQFVAMLRHHHVALVVADTAGKYPIMQDVTSDFIYVRLHGEEELYASGYTEESLDEWARKIGAWGSGGDAPDAKRIGPAATKAPGRDVYVYFDNDIKVRSPFDAARLAVKFKLRQKPLDAPDESSDASKRKIPVPTRQWALPFAGK